MTILPPELWDLILGFLSTNSSKELVLTTYVSIFFKELTELNEGFKYKTFLYKNNLEDAPLTDQFERAAECNYPEILKYIHRTVGLTAEHIRDKDFYIFKCAGGYGYLETLKWIYYTFNLDVSDQCVAVTFRWAAEDDRSGGAGESSEARLEVLKWLYSTFNIKKNVISHNKFSTIRIVAENGHLEVLKWLHSVFKLKKKNIQRDDLPDFKQDIILQRNSAFLLAAENGHLEVLKWLHSTFNLTSEDIRRNNNGAFRWATFNGHLPVLKWLHSTFNLSDEDIRSNNNLALRWATRGGIYKETENTRITGENELFLVPVETRLEILNWLHSTFNLTRKDLENSGDCHSKSTFFRAVKHNDLEILMWLYSAFGLTERDLSSEDTIFQLSVSKGYLEVSQWLYDIFNLNNEDIRKNCNHIIRIAAKNNYIELLKWLISKI